jgi:hypothetical protein
VEESEVEEVGVEEEGAEEGEELVQLELCL